MFSNSIIYVLRLYILDDIATPSPLLLLPPPPSPPCVTERLRQRRKRCVYVRRHHHPNVSSVVNTIASFADPSAPATVLTAPFSLSFTKTSFGSFNAPVASLFAPASDCGTTCGLAIYKSLQSGRILKGKCNRLKVRGRKWKKQNANNFITSMCFGLDRLEMIVRYMQQKGRREGEGSW